MKQVHLFISGFVQGVGYRNFVRHESRKLGVTGWARNLSDRRVEVVAQADEDKLKQLIKICSRGPFLSQVKSISVEWQTPVELFNSFDRKQTE